MSENTILNKKQEEVLNFIRKSSSLDLTENKIVNAFKGKYARMTILNIINFLEKNDLVKKDIVNPQYHVITPNYENLLNKLEIELNEFEEKYLILTQKLKYISSSQKITEKEERNNLELGRSIHFLFQHLVNVYIMYALEIWPRQTKYNDKLWGTLCVTLFKRLRKMHTDLHLRISPTAEIPIFKNLVLNSFLLRKNNLELILKQSKENDIQSEIENVIDTLWKISKYFFPFVSPEFEKGPEPKEEYKPVKRIPNDWRDVIDYYTKRLDKH